MKLVCEICGKEFPIDVSKKEAMKHEHKCLEMLQEKEIQNASETFKNSSYIKRLSYEIERCRIENIRYIQFGVYVLTEDSEFIIANFEMQRDIIIDKNSVVKSAVIEEAIRHEILKRQKNIEGVLEIKEVDGWFEPCINGIRIADIADALQGKKVRLCIQG